MGRRALTTPATALAVLAVTASLSGCASDEDGPARGTAERFYQAVLSGQGNAACALLAPRTAEQMRSDGEDCGRSITGMGLRGGNVLASQVWGGEAQVRMTGDTLFLHRFPQGWLVRAAGCTPRGDRPYDCQVGG